MLGVRENLARIPTGPENYPVLPRSGFVLLKDIGLRPPGRNRREVSGPLPVTSDLLTVPWGGTRRIVRARLPSLHRWCSRWRLYVRGSFLSSRSCRDPGHGAEGLAGLLMTNRLWQFAFWITNAIVLATLGLGATMFNSLPYDDEGGELSCYCSSVFQNRLSVLSLCGLSQVQRVSRDY